MAAQMELEGDMPVVLRLANRAMMTQSRFMRPESERWEEVE